MHPEPPHALILRISVLLAFCLFASVAILVIVLVNKRMRRLEQMTRAYSHVGQFDPVQPAQTSMPKRSDTHALAPLWYIMSFVLWPVALICSIVFLQKPETARMGRNCAVLGVTYFMLVALATCTAMWIGADYIVPYIKP